MSASVVHQVRGGVIDYFGSFMRGPDESVVRQPGFAQELEEMKSCLSIGLAWTEPVEGERVGREPPNDLKSSRLADLVFLPLAGTSVTAGQRQIVA